MPEELIFLKIVQKAQEEERYLEELQRKAEENQRRVDADRKRRKQEHIIQRTKEIIIAILSVPAMIMVFKLIVAMRLCF